MSNQRIKQILTVKNLTIKQYTRILWDNISFSLQQGERLGISAPSGYGKTTLGRVLAGWQRYEKGKILINNHIINSKGYYPVQLIPQHPENGFNPYRTVGAGLYDAWRPDPIWLDKLSINVDWFKRRPNELSGGELARIALLKTLDPRTQFIIADEATAQLDAHTQLNIWQIMIEETKKRPLGMIIFSHNRSLLEKVCTSVWTF